ncbi:MAG: zf-HC2 domain-containing protein [Gammaproteobacteria bacterium]|jgi:hypothetical protein|nr:zf-HC2 domain-containing protein [Candidatus Thioaporhodococcus sediminis]TNF52591.1 MAG: zf-HC2 domain-containing protein [Gammaproteobacteria bacterium]
MLTCKDASHLLSESQERQLSPRERWGLRLHLWMCVSCRRLERQLAFMHRAMRSLRRRAESEANAAELPVAARERIRRALREGQGQSRD